MATLLGCSTVMMRTAGGFISEVCVPLLDDEELVCTASV